MASWDGAMEESLRGLPGFKAIQQMAALASLKAMLTIVKKAWWQSPGAAPAARTSESGPAG